MPNLELHKGWKNLIFVFFSCKDVPGKWVETSPDLSHASNLTGTIKKHVENVPLYLLERHQYSWQYLIDKLWDKLKGEQ